ncbi:SLATT domain-containing protein [Pendulispora albinea]|uniref:SLATT domain-containing protein n=1 Tax=Pendulispora albinea TaxID=2741071 RepID=A0ABZ2LQI4_9BACT
MEFDRAMGSHPPPDIKDLLAEWQAWAQVSSKSHRRAAVRLERRHYWLGVPSTLMGAIVGTTIFGTIEKAATSLPLKIALAVVSMTAAGLVALQTFFRYLERAGQHNLAHAEYDDIARSIELLSVDTKSRPDWVKSLEGLGHRLDAIKGKAPIPPDADDLEHEAEALKERFRLRLSASVMRRERPHDVRGSNARLIEAHPSTRPSPARLRRAPAIPPTEFFSGPLDSSRFYEEDERIAAWREAKEKEREKERARLDTERRVREVAEARSFSSEERDGTSPDDARTTSAQRGEAHRLEGGSFAAQLRAFEAVDN